MVVDPGGVQAFFLARLLVATAAVAVGTVLLFVRVSVPGSLPVRLAVCGLLATLALSAALAAAPAVAFFGASGRQLGALAWVLFAVAFVVGASLYRNGEERIVGIAVVTVAAAAVLLIGFYAAFEAAGHPLVVSSQDFPGRLQGTFGNPAALGAYLSLVLPVLAAGIVSRIRLWLAVPGVGVGLWLLVVSGARGAWIGVGTASLFAVGRFAVGRGRRRRAALGLGAVLVAVLALTVPTGRWGSAAAGLEGRLRTWEVGARVVAEYPLLGVGPEGFRKAFAENVDDRFVIEYTRDQVTDRAHAGLLDLTITGGLLSLLFYGTALAGVGWLLLRAFCRAPRHHPVTFGLAGGILAYLIQQQVFFQLACLDIVLWFLVGVLAVQLGFGRPLATSRRPLAGMAVATALIMLTYTMLGVAADHQDHAAVAAGPSPRALDLFESAARFRPFDTIHPLLAVGLLRSLEEPVLLDREVALIDQALRWAPGDGVLLLSRSGLLVAEYRATGDPTPLGEAEAMLLTLISRDTTNGEAFLRLGTIGYYRGDFDAAEEYWTEAARLMPHRPEPSDNLAVLSSQH